MKWFLDSNYKHWAVMPNNFNELKHKAICPECNEIMHPHHFGEPKEVGLTGKNMVEVRIQPFLPHERP